MSMFKTLQTNPGTITLFRSKSPISTLLLEQLQSHTTKPDTHSTATATSSFFSKIKSGFGSSEDKESGINYNLEDLPSGKPTYDQLKLIRSYTFTAQTNNKNPRSHNLQVFRHSFPLFKEINEGGKGLVNEEEFVELIKNTEWFVEPLVVDWDKGTLANDEESLNALLKEYD